MKTVFQVNSTEWCIFGPMKGEYELHVRNAEGRWAWFADGFKSKAAAVKRAENASYSYAA